METTPFDRHHTLDDTAPGGRARRARALHPGSAALPHGSADMGRDDLVSENTAPDSDGSVNDSSVNDIVVSGRAMRHATDSHSMPIPDARARCTRHDRVRFGAALAYICADALALERWRSSAL